MEPGGSGGIAPLNIYSTSTAITNLNTLKGTVIAKGSLAVAIGN